MGWARWRCSSWGIRGQGTTQPAAIPSAASPSIMQELALGRNSDIIYLQLPVFPQMTLFILARLVGWEV